MRVVLGDLTHKLSGFLFTLVSAGAKPRRAAASLYRENGEFLLQCLFSKNIGKEVVEDFTAGLTNSSYAWINNEY